MKLHKSLMAALLCAMALFSVSSQAATAWATVSKNKVAKNEVFQLRVVVDEKASSGDIDFSQLEDDFFISRPSFGTSVNIINGERNVRSEWNISLAALKLGTHTIPSFSVSGTESQPINITVVMDQDTPDVSELIELQNHLDKTQLYPSESAILKSRLIIKADPRRLQNPKVVPPLIKGMTLTAQGEPNQYQSVLDGVEVTVLDQTYRVTALESGTYTLNAPAFNGAVVYGNNRTGTTKLISVDTKPEQFAITVEPKPSQYQGFWLPSSKLTLSQVWKDQDGNQIDPSTPFNTSVGESLTREVSLSIEGLTSEQFPNLVTHYPDSIRLYAEKPHFSTNDDGLVTMTIKQVLIPQQAGEVQLDNLSVNWWHSQTKTPKTASITGLVLNVEPGEAFNTIAPTSTPPPQQPVKIETVTLKDSGVWPYLTALFAALWLATLVYFLKQRKTPKQEEQRAPYPADNNLTALKEALQRKDVIQAQLYGQRWLQSQQNLRSEDKAEFESALSRLARAFSTTPSENDTQTLLKMLEALEKQTRFSKASKEHLAKL
ncbi:BatD family protein [Vibrio sp. SCSIO 43135]|uniref:BatD family protein n=1 Tax=Vibrio sp. SCSIO 43135 TaxID=2819096 RepID=UPI00207658D1|nr:BatD family protein [Vibrio sp. SCSIO 43135]